LNRGFTYTETIGRRDEGRRLLEYLSGRYAHTLEPVWRERIEGGLVLVDGRRGSSPEVLCAGQTVTWSRPPWEEPSAPLVYAVLFEDEDLLAAAKPSGLPTLPGAGYLENTLLALVRQRTPCASPVHRLGRGTSGVVLFAKTLESMRALSEAWREHRVTKIYRALATGTPEADEFVVETPIGPVPHPALGAVYAASPDGKTARSFVSVIERREESALVEVRIETGRPHQIRIHMAASGYPLVGDPLYVAGGGIRGGDSALPGDTGYWLHAMRLSLPHPRTGEPFSVECPPPLTLRAGV
jgi:23S rRNA pseudouridine1911/1915/1917 synthase